MKTKKISAKYGGIITAAICLVAMIVKADCNRTNFTNFQTTEDPNTCTKTTVYNQQCAKPNPDDWTQGCTEHSGTVHIQTWHGNKSTYKMLVNVCTMQFGADCSSCVYTGNPVDSQGPGTVATVYKCG